MEEPSFTFLADCAKSRCTLRYTDEYGNSSDREFFASQSGGAVYEGDRNPRQVCEGLKRLGATLYWQPDFDATLADLIRRECNRNKCVSSRVLFPE